MALSNKFNQLSLYGGGGSGSDIPRKRNISMR